MNPLWLVVACTFATSPQQDPQKIGGQDPSKQVPAPAPAPAPGGDLKPEAKKVEAGEVDPAKDPAREEAAKKRAAAVDRALDQLDTNKVVASANGDIFTLRDVLLDWKLLGRADANPDRSTVPSDKEQRQILKEMVRSRLWLAHARLFPAWGDIASAELIDEYAKLYFGPLLGDPSLTEEEKKLIRRRGEEILAQIVTLNNDPEFRRASTARPSDVQRYWEARPERHRDPTRTTLARVQLGRELYGDKVDELAQQIRKRALETGSLETAARELAPGSYSEPRELKGVSLEGNTSMRDEIFAFAKTAQTGELSPPLGFKTTVMIFSVILRAEGSDLTFEKAAPQLKEEIETFRRQFRSEEYFVLSILRESTFLPPDLFEEEIERFLGPRMPHPQKPATAAAAAATPSTKK